MKTRLTRLVLAALLLTAVLATAGYGAANGSQTATVTAAAKINIGVPASVSIASTDPGACGTTTTTISVQSNKLWNLQIRSEPLTYPNGRAKNGATEMVNAFQYLGGSVATFTAITSTYANLFGVSQAKTAARNVSVDYQQCVSYLDDPATYTIVVEYLGIQP